MENPPTGESEKETIPPAEWVVAGIGLILLCLSMGSLIHKALDVEESEPRIAFSIESIVQQGDGVLVVARASNHGGETVSDFHVTGSAGSEEHELVIDYLPARSSREFGVFFATRVQKEDVKFTPGAYQMP